MNRRHPESSADLPQKGVLSQASNGPQVKADSLTCANKNKDSTWIHVTSYRTWAGPFCLWRITTDKDTRDRTQNYGLQPAPWDSPQKTTDLTPYSVLMADLIEKGTDGAAGLTRITSAPHTASGARLGGSGQMMEPFFQQAPMPGRCFDEDGTRP